MAAPTTTAAVILWILLMFPFPATSAAASEFSLVVSGIPTTLELSPSLIVENSPGSKPHVKSKCERVQIHGLSRINHLDKYASSVKVKVSLVSPTGRLRPPNIEVCFHGNASLEVGMCPKDQWEKLIHGLWVKSMSPFNHRMIVDVRTATSYSGSFQVSLEEEFFLYRIVLLCLSFVLMCLVSWLSKSLAFYYVIGMLVGVFVLILMIIFHGRKLLPGGQRNSLTVLLYWSFLVFGSFQLRAFLVGIGVSEDMHYPLAVFGLVLLVIIGAWMGFCVVRKLVVADDGVSVDPDVSRFAAASIWFVASVMILQSSSDCLLAAEACLGVIVSKVLRDCYARSKSSVGRLFDKKLRKRKSVRGSMLSDSQTFYSSFHDIPDRRKYAKEEWESFTKESTGKALEGLFSSPEFTKWAVSNADKLKR